MDPPSFRIPLKKAKLEVPAVPARGVERIDLKPEDHDYRRITEQVTKSFFDRQLVHVAQLSNIRCYRNNNLEWKFNQFKEAVKRLGHPGTETWSYCEVLNRDEEQYIALNGYAVNPERAPFMGDTKKGVTLFRHADLTSAAPFYRNSPRQVMIFKTIRGRMFEVLANYEENQQPHPEKLSHIVSPSQKPPQNATRAQIQRLSAVYHYEFAGNSKEETVQVPTGILPFAFVQIDVVLDTKAKRCLTIPSMRSLFMDFSLHPIAKLPLKLHRSSFKGVEICTMFSAGSVSPGLSSGFLVWKTNALCPIGEFGSIVGVKELQTNFFGQLSTLPEINILIQKSAAGQNHRGEVFASHAVLRSDENAFRQLVEDLYANNYFLVAQDFLRTTHVFVPPGDLSSSLGLPSVAGALHVLSLAPSSHFSGSFYPQMMAEFENAATVKEFKKAPPTHLMSRDDADFGNFHRICANETFSRLTRGTGPSQKSPGNVEPMPEEPLFVPVAPIEIRPPPKKGIVRAPGAPKKQARVTWAEAVVDNQEKTMNVQEVDVRKRKEAEEKIVFPPQLDVSQLDPSETNAAFQDVFRNSIISSTNRAEPSKQRLMPPLPAAVDGPTKKETSFPPLPTGIVKSNEISSLPLPNRVTRDRKWPLPPSPQPPQPLVQQPQRPNAEPADRAVDDDDMDIDLGDSDVSHDRSIDDSPQKPLRALQTPVEIRPSTLTSKKEDDSVDDVEMEPEPDSEAGPTHYHEESGEDLLDYVLNSSAPIQSDKNKEATKPSAALNASTTFNTATILNDNAAARMLKGMESEELRKLKESVELVKANRTNRFGAQPIAAAQMSVPIPPVGVLPAADIDLRTMRPSVPIPMKTAAVAFSIQQLPPKQLEAVTSVVNALGDDDNDEDDDVIFVPNGHADPRRSKQRTDASTASGDKDYRKLRDRDDRVRDRDDRWNQQERANAKAKPLPTETQTRKPPDDCFLDNIPMPPPPLTKQFKEQRLQNCLRGFYKTKGLPEPSTASIASVITHSKYPTDPVQQVNESLAGSSITPTSIEEIFDSPASPEASPAADVFEPEPLEIAEPDELASMGQPMSILQPGTIPTEGTSDWETRHVHVPKTVHSSPAASKPFGWTAKPRGHLDTPYDNKTISQSDNSWQQALLNRNKLRQSESPVEEEDGEIVEDEEEDEVEEDAPKVEGNGHPPSDDPPIRPRAHPGALPTAPTIMPQLRQPLLMRPPPMASTFGAFNQPSPSGPTGLGRGIWPPHGPPAAFPGLPPNRGGRMLAPNAPPMGYYNPLRREPEKGLVQASPVMAAVPQQLQVPQQVQQYQPRSAHALIATIDTMMFLPAIMSSETLVAILNTLVSLKVEHGTLVKLYMHKRHMAQLARLTPSDAKFIYTQLLCNKGLQWLVHELPEHGCNLETRSEEGMLQCFMQLRRCANELLPNHKNVDVVYISNMAPMATLALKASKIGVRVIKYEDFIRPNAHD